MQIPIIGYVSYGPSTIPFRTGFDYVLWGFNQTTQAIESLYPAVKYSYAPNDLYLQKSPINWYAR